LANFEVILDFVFQVPNSDIDQLAGTTAALTGNTFHFFYLNGQRGQMDFGNFFEKSKLKTSPLCVSKLFQRY
jgi:hypothetical protein